MTDTIIEYFSYQKKYNEIYGNKCVVFGKYGDFYDAFQYTPKKCLSESDKIDKYGVVWQEEIGCASDISDLIDCDFTMKNTNKAYGIKNVNLVGFPTIAWNDKVKILLQNDYVVVKLDQNENEKNEQGNYKRFVGDIISPFMTFDTISVNRIHANNVVVTLDYISAKNVHYMDGYMIAVGFASFDLITGMSTITEFYSKENNETYYIEELTRLLSIYYPKDIGIYLNNMPNMTSYVKYLERTLELKRYDRYVVHLNKVSAEHRKLNYQKEFLNKLYEKNTHKINNNITNANNVGGIIYNNERIIEELDLSKFNYGRLAFILLCQYCKVQNGPIDNLRVPEVKYNTDYLILTHNAAVSIEVIPSAHQKCKAIMNNLYAVMEHTCTNIGKRCLENKLLNPMIDMDEIQYHYDMVDEFMQIYTPTNTNTNLNGNTNNNLSGNATDNTNNNLMGGLGNEPLWAIIERQLYVVPDFARLQRRVELRNVLPRELATIVRGYCKLVDIFGFLFSLPITNTINLLNKQVDLTGFYEMVCFFDKIDTTALHYCELDKLNCGKVLLTFDTNPFIKNDYICNLFTRLNTTNKQLDTIVAHLNNFLKTDAIILSTKHINKKGKISKKNTKYESKNTYLTTSLTNANKIVTCKYDVSLCGTVTATPFITKEKMISSEIIGVLCQQKDGLEKEIGVTLYECFHDVAEELLSFAKHFTGVCYAVGLLDLIHTYAKISYKNKYYKPTLKAGDSFLRLKELRHPIVEKLIDYEYVSNDFSLGKQHVEDNAPYGILMYGINGAGKSLSLKAIGLVIIMAQAGCFVPAIMEYHPYERIITRLSTQDNISTGQSSYDVEITELRTILKQGNKSSLVFADELASRTESQSATCITASAIIELLNQKVSFLFTSHIHEVATLPDIVSLPSTLLKVCHLAVNYDYETDNLIYNRKIQQGSGTSRYGLDVARYHKLPASFLDRAYKIANYLEEEHEEYLSSKNSHFNVNVLMHHCNVCKSKKNLQTHHIKPQKDADIQGYIGNMHKNKKDNLLVLCDVCHLKITLENKELQVLRTINGHIIKY